MGCGRKSYLGPAEVATFSSRDFSGSNKHDTFGLVVLAGYFYVFFLRTIAVSGFCSLEIYENLGLPLSTVTFTFTVTFTVTLTATQVTISINMFICFKYYTV